MNKSYKFLQKQLSKRTACNNQKLSLVIFRHMDIINYLPTSIVSCLFDHVSETTFFAKDRDGKFVTCNQELIRILRLNLRDEIFGKNDFDFFPKHNAERYWEDDQEVMESKDPKLNILELIPNEIGQMFWYVTHKYPVVDENGTCIGITGICQKKEGKYLRTIFPESLSKVLEYIAENYSEKIQIQQLADLSFLSQRTLERLFKKTFNRTIAGYIRNVRAQAVFELLKSSTMSLGEIAHSCGYCDQSYMSKEFKKQFGVTPKKYLSLV